MKRILQISFLLIALVFAACKHEKTQCVFFINSYHDGYGSSDDVMDGIKEVLAEKVILKIAFMDSKRNSDAAFIDQKVKEILADIERFKPDVIIASDDNAIKYIIKPHFTDGKTPVVFCGVNWSADQYQLPRHAVTGMLEVMPFRQTVKVAGYSFPKISKLTVLSENTGSEEKNKIVMKPIFDELGLEVSFSLVDNFGDWKTAFRTANKNSDIIYIPTNGAIKNWDEQAAKQFVFDNISKPVITCDDFMMKYAVFGLTKIAKEQGEWAARRALEIIDGKKTEDIQISKNQQSQAWLNKKLASKIGFEVPDTLVDNVNLLNE